MTPDIDLIADYAAGALPPGPAHDRVAALVATDPEWASLHAALVEADVAVGAGLAGLRDDVALPAAADVAPMPAELAGRLDAALRGLRPADIAPGDGRAGDSAPRDKPVDELAARRARRRRWYTVSGAAAAGVAVLAAGALGLAAFQPTSNDERTSADSAAAPAEAAPSPTATLEAQVTGSYYTPTTLQPLVNLLVLNSAPANKLQPAPRSEADSGATRSQLTPSELDRLKTPAELADCLSTIGTPLAADLARYQGEPAIVVVLPGSDATTFDVVVAGPDCSVADPDLILRTTVSR